MPARYADNDHYTYEDSPVLINKRGIRDAHQLKQLETTMGVVRSMQTPPSGTFNTAHLQAIHHHIFQDIYDWAGEFRDVHICLGNSPFAAPRYIEQNLNTLLSDLAREDCLNDATWDAFAERAAHYVNELNAIHPFRDGNGRTIRLFLFMLAENAGFDLHPDIIQTGWLQASIEGFKGDNGPMRELLNRALEAFEN